jgi:ABC-type transport system substrate-binding protein
LLVEAGYPRGRDAVTGKPLLIYFDGYDSFARARLELLIKQLARIDIQLVPRLTEWNRFQEKMRRGNWQMSFWGWNADYPDPETFLFQYYGPNSKVRSHGENVTNFNDPEFDRLYEQFQVMDLDADRQPLIDAMVEILRRESPLAGGWQREAFVLNHSWFANAKPGKINRAYRKYYAVDPQLRAERQLAWNRPRLGALFGLALLLVTLAVLATLHYRRHERARAVTPGRSA